MRDLLTLRPVRVAVLFAVALLAHAVDASGLFGAPPLEVLIAAVATYDITTSESDVNRVWRKVQADLAQAIRFESEEWDFLGDMDEFDIDWSAREITIPVDITEGAGVASIPEGGYEARPSSPNAQELTISWILLNATFTISKTARWVDQNSRAAMIERQIVFQGRNKVRTLARTFNKHFYGFSTGVLAKTSTNATQSSGEYTLKDAYGVSGIDNAAFLANLFRIGDHVALVRSGSLVSNAIGEITDIDSSTPSLDIDWNGSVDSDDDDQIVLANSLENESLEGTDWNRGLVGVLDAMTSTSVHSLSSSSVPEWDVAHSDTASGRFTGVKLHRAKQEIGNDGPNKPDTVIWDQGVERDALAQFQAGVRYSDPFNLEMDGEPKSRGMSFHAWQNVPPGYVFVQAKRTFRKMTLLPKPERPMWGDADKLENRSGFVLPVDYPVGLVHLARKNYAYFSNQTRS